MHWSCNPVKSIRLRYKALLNPPKIRKCTRCSVEYRNSKTHRSIRCPLCIKLPKALKTSFDDMRSDRSRKRWLLENQDQKCQVCSLKEWCGKPITLELDHIDGNSDNNAIENLRLICPNCHSQTPTFKGKNRGHGRIERMKRYRAGLSF